MRGSSAAWSYDVGVYLPAELRRAAHVRERGRGEPVTRHDGYPAKGEPLASLPRVPPGAAPGANVRPLRYIREDVVERMLADQSTQQEAPKAWPSEEEQEALMLALFEPGDDCAHNLVPMFTAVERIVAARVERAEAEADEWKRQAGINVYRKRAEKAEARVAEVEREREHWKRVAGHTREKAEGAEERAEKLDQAATMWREEADGANAARACVIQARVRAESERDDLRAGLAALAVDWECGDLGYPEPVTVFVRELRGLISDPAAVLAERDAEVRADERRRCVEAIEGLQTKRKCYPLPGDDGIAITLRHAALAISGLGGEEVEGRG